MDFYFKLFNVKFNQFNQSKCDMVIKNRMNLGTLGLGLCVLLQAKYVSFAFPLMKAKTVIAFPSPRLLKVAGKARCCGSNMVCTHQDFCWGLVLSLVVSGGGT